MKMSFGKYKGWPLDQVPKEYLFWALDNCKTLSPFLRQEIENTLRDEGTDMQPAAQLHGILRQWHREMVMKFHPDRGGNVEAMKAINIGVERLRELAAQGAPAQ